jgi:hypothetical protein
MPSPTLTPHPPTAPEAPLAPEVPSAADVPPAAETLPPAETLASAETLPPAETLASAETLPAPEDPPSAETLASAELSRLRLVPVPAGWPPYDCETHGAACPVARAAAQANPHVSSQPPGLAEPAGPPGPAATPAAPGQVRPCDIPAWPRQFAQVIVEILAGSRPTRQIVPWTTDRVRGRIDLLSQMLASDQRPSIRRIMTSRPAARVVEMTVVVSFGPRSRALAMRFEHMPARRPVAGLPVRPARWLCTEIETG